MQNLPALPTLQANLAIAVSFGQFISPHVIHGLEHGGINLHPSLLPRYRGPAPIHRALLHGDSKTGVSVQTLDTEQFDHGRILAQREVAIEENEDMASLHDRLAQRGAELLVECLEDGLRGSVHPPYKASYAQKVTKADMQVDFAKHTAREILRKARAFPSLWTWSIEPAQRMQIKEVTLAHKVLPVGLVKRNHEGMLAGTVEGTICIAGVKRAGGEWQISKL